MLKPYFQTDLGKLYHSDCLEVVKQLPDNHIQCVVTSPPYWGLRDYGTATWEGGSSSCNHIIGNQVQDNKAIGAITLGVRPGCDSFICKKCGAKRIDKQIGIEKTPEEYVEKLVILFREVRRVLKDNGILWLNIGSSYYGGKGQSNYAFQERRNSNSIEQKQHNITGIGETRPQDNKSDLMELRDDLTSQEISYVLRELAYGIDDKLQRGYQDHD